MQLFQLPTEILQVIISQIDSRASLARLAQVCRFLEALVDPILYQSVYLRNHDGEIFIRALELRPARAQYIRELLIHYHYVNVPDQQAYYPLLVEGLVPTIRRLVNLRRLTVKGLLYDAPRDYDDPDLGNVERFDAYAVEWFRLFEHAGGADVLPSLESCQMIMDDVPYDPEIRTELWSFDTRSAVMIHPHLRDLTLVGALVGGLDPALQYEPRSTRLESLTLLCCDVSSDGLRELLRIPEALKHLTWKGVPATAPPEFWPGDRQSYVDAIRTHADSLVSLDLDFYAIGGHHPPLDFRDFRSLRQLTIDPGVLRGDTTDADGNARHATTECLLPGSLQGLVLREYREYSVPDQETLPLVYRWVSSGALPSLRSVVDGFNNPASPYTKRPLLYCQPATDESTPDRVLIQYARRYFTGFQAQPRSADIPPITEAQAEALDALHFLAEQHSAALDFQKGDVQYINNLSIFHARNGFRDEPGKERHLLRLWLRDPEYAWETPGPLRKRWDIVYKDVRVEEQVFPLEPRLRKTVGA